MNKEKPLDEKIEELKKEIEECREKQRRYKDLSGRNHKKSEMGRVSLECYNAGEKLPLLKAKLSAYEDVREAVLELKGKIEENKVGVNMKCNNCGNITEMSICPECAFYDLSDNFMIRVDELYEDINKIFGTLAEEDLK